MPSAVSDTRAFSHSLLATADDSLDGALGAALAEAGLAARRVRSPEQLLTQLLACPDAIVLIDLDLPGVASLLAGLPGADGSRPVLWLAGADEPDLPARAAAAGISGWLRKPLEPAAVAHLASTLLRRHAALALARSNESALLQSLADARIVSSAVGMLAERHRLPMERAFDMLRREARASRQPMPVAAARTIDAGKP